MSENTHNKIKTANSGIKKLFFSLIAFTMVMTGLTAYSIVQEQNNNAKNSFAAALYACSSSETLSGQNCLSDRLSFPKYELKCKDGFTLMDTSCVKFDVKPCNFFSKGVDAENGMCKFDAVTIYGGEILNYDGRECNGNGNSFYRYNVGLSFNDTTGPIICGNTYSDILGNANFRWMPKSIKEISNLETIQTGTQYSPCPAGYTDSGVNFCSRPASLKSCSAGEIPNAAGNLPNIFENVKASAMEFESEQLPVVSQVDSIFFDNTKNTKTDGILTDFEYLNFGDNVKVDAETTAINTNQSLVATETNKTIVDVTSSNPNFSTLVAALKAADLVSTLEGAGPFTVVAPTNEAFANLPAGVLTALLKPENKGILTKILTYHVIPGKNTASAILTLNGKSVNTVEGSGINVNVNSGKIILNDSSNVTTTDILATNGVIHVIDKVLLPASLNLESLLNKELNVETKNIVDITSSNPNFSTLVAALKSADLVTTLQGSGPFTVVAPTNEAFANLPAGVLTALLKPENKATLSKILTYHVIPGKNTASAILTLNGKSVNTVEGSGINVTVNNGKIILNGSTNVTIADILATNGVIHVIDKVLIPSGLNFDTLLTPKTITYNPSSACVPCPPNFYCSISTTDPVRLSCGSGSTLVGDKCKGLVKVSKTTYTDGCGAGYVKYDQTCAVEQFRDRDIDVCSYYFASNNIFINAVTEPNGQCSTGGRTDFDSTNIFKVSDLLCAGPGSGWYNYNVAYDPLVCGYNTYDSNNKAAFRWSAKSFTKITGLQKIATQTQVCPVGWVDAGTIDNNCVQDPIGLSFSSQTPCPVGSFSPANSTSISACVTPVVAISSVISSSVVTSTSSPKPLLSSSSSAAPIVSSSSLTPVILSSSVVSSVVSSSSPTPVSSSSISSSSSVAVCRILGKVYLDPNQNGTQDSNEADGSLPSGILATLKKGDTIVLTATPDANGNYIFENIPCNAGVHTITIAAPSTYTISNSTQNGEGTGSNPTTINISSNTTKTFDAGKDGIYLTPTGGVITITTQSSSSVSSSSSVASSSSVTQGCASAQPGYYINGAVCVICPAGYYCVGNKEPNKICPIGTYCPEGSITPTLCPAGKTTASEGSKSIEACISIALVAASNPTTTITTTRTGGLATLSLFFALATAITGAYAYYDSHMKKSVHAGWNKLK